MGRPIGPSRSFLTSADAAVRHHSRDERPAAGRVPPRHVPDGDPGDRANPAIARPRDRSRQRRDGPARLALDRLLAAGAGPGPELRLDRARAQAHPPRLRARHAARRPGAPAPGRAGAAQEVPLLHVRARDRYRRSDPRRLSRARRRARDPAIGRPARPRRRVGRTESARTATSSSPAGRRALQAAAADPGRTDHVRDASGRSAGSRGPRGRRRRRRARPPRTPDPRR